MPGPGQKPPPTLKVDTAKHRLSRHSWQRPDEHPWVPTGLASSQTHRATFPGDSKLAKALCGHRSPKFHCPLQTSPNHVPFQSTPPFHQHLDPDPSPQFPAQQCGPSSPLTCRSNKPDLQSSMAFPAEKGRVYLCFPQILPYRIIGQASRWPRDGT